MMQVYQSERPLPNFKNAVLTIGTFDGLHEGHKKIIQALIEEAKAVGGASIVISFDPHPRKIIRENTSLQLITTLKEKIGLFSKTGVEHFVVVPFTKEFSSIQPEAYIGDFLISKFRPHTIIIGYDHRFGQDRKGDFSLLAKNADKYQYRLLEIPKHLLDEVAVSSTKIRQAILQGDMETANRLLGYTFFFEGKVVEGDKIGRELGYPTANLDIEDADKIIPGDGVYAVFVKVQGQLKTGMLSIGNRPTFNKPGLKIEVHILDFEGDLYGQTIQVYVSGFLRKQEKYITIEALKDQLKLDQINTEAFLKFRQP